MGSSLPSRDAVGSKPPRPVRNLHPRTPLYRHVDLTGRRQRLGLRILILATRAGWRA